MGPGPGRPSPDFLKTNTCYGHNTKSHLKQVTVCLCLLAKPCFSCLRNTKVFPRYVLVIKWTLSHASTSSRHRKTRMCIRTHPWRPEWCQNNESWRCIINHDNSWWVMMTADPKKRNDTTLKSTNQHGHMFKTYKWTPWFMSPNIYGAEYIV